MDDRQKARGFILDVLADGPVDVKSVMERAKAEGIKRRDIQELRKQGGLFTTMPNVPEGRWYWVLIGDVKE